MSTTSYRAAGEQASLARGQIAESIETSSSVERQILLMQAIAHALLAIHYDLIDRGR